MRKYKKNDRKGIDPIYLAQLTYDKTFFRFFVYCFCPFLTCKAACFYQIK